MKKEILEFEEITIKEMLNTNGGSVSEGTGGFLRWLGWLFAYHNDPYNKAAWEMTHKI
ncbi:hypothetical protein [Proteiniphilum sp.]|uniref:hypothetical protein n=1 Tax=Proteiniphilum sp. TaxID=1926877 RepID=UPI002680D2E8|nr:hypothetical protein [Proteiniphilum sp.]MEA5127950.1 hypothetical protein [Proteiniphilum sp.]